MMNSLVAGKLLFGMLIAAWATMQTRQWKKNNNNNNNIKSIHVAYNSTRDCLLLADSVYLSSHCKLLQKRDHIYLECMNSCLFCIIWYYYLNYDQFTVVVVVVVVSTVTMQMNREKTRTNNSIGTPKLNPNTFLNSNVNWHRLLVSHPIALSLLVD